MAEELVLFFPNADQVFMKYNDETTRTLSFNSPVTDEDREDIRWYLEVYAVQYTAEPDDDRAERIENKLKTWGEALFAQAFSSDLSKRIFYRFYDACGQEGGLITIDTAIPDILSLPWELLCVEGRQLVHEYPHMAIRHRLSGAG
ncbi:MAG: hypothetical protein GY866_38435, partial [Proteobacteria bacterium]|nr:hypothetical protein [Pseudomonadota bacterium]